MPRADHYPPDIMDRYAAFISAVNELKSQLEDWERRYHPNQPRIPAGQPQAANGQGEAEAQWRRERDFDAPIAILNMVIHPNIPIR